MLALTSPPPTIGELCALACVASVNNAPGNKVCPSPTMEHTPRKPRRSNPKTLFAHSRIIASPHPSQARHCKGFMFRTISLVLRGAQFRSRSPASILFENSSALDSQTSSESRLMSDIFRAHLLKQHLKLAFRVLKNAPAYSALVIAILALGIGANTAVFSVIDAVLIRQLPYGDAHRLVVVWEKNPALGKSVGERVPVSYANFDEWARQAKSFQDIAGFESVNLNRTGSGDPERIDGARRLAELLSAFSVIPALGTTLASVKADPGNAHIAMLSNAYWQTRFGGSRSAIGQTITLNDSIYTIVGVLPANFYMPSTARAPTSENRSSGFLTT